MDAAPELRRRITYLMLFRVVLITLVLGITAVLNAAAPEQVTSAENRLLYAIIIGTYAISLGYAFWLPRARRPLRFATAQLIGDLILTTVLVHVTGGAQSQYTFFYPLSIVGAASVRYRRGAEVVAIASVALFVTVALLGWLGALPMAGNSALTEVPLTVFLRQLVLNVGACTAIGVLAAYLGAELGQSGERLERQRLESLDLAALQEDIIRCISSGLVTIAKDGTILTFNGAAAEILGVHAGQAIGRRISDLLPELDRLLDGLGEREALRRGEIHVHTGGRELVLGVSASPLVDHRDATMGRILNFLDLTDLRRMELQVRQAERLAVIGGVAAAVAHEIRNPLASISGSIELLRGVSLDADNQRLMDIVLREVDRLNGLLTELLDYARPRERLLMPIDLGAVLDETARVFAQDRTHGGRLEIELRGGRSGIMVAADAAQLRQVVWNLLRNAAEAMPGAGRITLTLELVDDGRTAQVQVVDAGVGISAEDLEHIFEPFFTTKRSGTGLGLPTVHRIVTEHGGQVAVNSVLGQGATVTLRLPLLDPAAQAASAAAALAPHDEVGATESTR